MCRVVSCASYSYFRLASSFPPIPLLSHHVVFHQRYDHFVGKARQSHQVGSSPDLVLYSRFDQWIPCHLCLLQLIEVSWYVYNGRRGCLRDGREVSVYIHMCQTESYLSRLTWSQRSLCPPGIVIVPPWCHWVNVKGYVTSIVYQVGCDDRGDEGKWAVLRCFVCSSSKSSTALASRWLSVALPGAMVCAFGLKQKSLLFA